MSKEPLEEAAERHSNETLRDNSYVSFIEGAKWQAERMYSEEEVKKLFNQYKEYFSIYRNIQITDVDFEKWVKQFKKK